MQIWGSRALLVHCNMRFRPEEIQFLHNNEFFTHRRIEIGHCPKCEKLLARLVEKRVTDGQWFDTTYSRRKADKLIKAHETQVDYTSLSFPKQTKTLHGFRYGENYERVNKKTGEVTVIQKACDFHGNKEIVKIIQ